MRPPPPRAANVDAPDPSHQPGLAPPAIRSRGITARAVMFGLVCMVINAYWITVIEVRWYTLDGTCLPLFITPIFFLLCLCILNVPIGRVRKDWRFDQGELLTIYLMLVTSSVLAGHDLVQNLFGVIAHADRYNTPERGYERTFFKFLEPAAFLLVRDERAIEGFYEGGVQWWRPENFMPFVGPLLWWALFLAVLIGMCLSISVIIRKAWTDNEKLAFPIVQLPLAMTNPEGRSHVPFWRSKAMWAGFAVAASIGLINGLHHLYPSWPNLPWVKQYHIGQYFPHRPWNALWGTNISMYPFAIGLAYFLPLDLAFSLWFFFVARELFQVMGVAAGWDAAGHVGFPYFEQQSSGAWIALGVVIAWSLRSHIGAAWHTAFGRARRVDASAGASARFDPGEAKRLRWSFIFLALGTGYLFWFGSTIGLSWWVGVLFFGIFFLLSVAIARVRAELGTPHEIFFVNPRTVVVTLFGVPAVGGGPLTAMSVLYWYNRGYRCHPMPNHIEAFKMAEGGRLQVNRLVWLLIGATIFAIFAAYWANLQVTFSEGATGRAAGFKGWVGFESYDRLSQWLQTPTERDFREIAYMVGGAVMVLGLRLMRGAVTWWPFHPAGYALAVSFAMDYFWFAFFISWLVKFMLVRFGGMRAHNAGIPFFLGLILGDYTIGSIWAIYGPVMGLQVYKIFI
ncbi:MAG TPA: DUF6785 family protein [Chthonomonadales bacterium]|nr:DUF6785 family protein [Chthonomonadales bacterium]